MRSAYVLLLITLATGLECQTSLDNPTGKAHVAEYEKRPCQIHLERGKKWQAPYQGVIQEPTTGVDEILTFVHTTPTSALPIESSDAVVFVEVISAESYLTPDKTNVFTEYSSKVTKVLGSTSRVSVREGDVITAERRGGTVKFPSGKLLRFRIQGQGELSPGSNYLLFLRGDAVGDDFRIVTAYETAKGKITNVDSAWLFRTYKGVDESTIISDVETLLKLGKLGQEVTLK